VTFIRQLAIRITWIATRTLERAQKGTRFAKDVHLTTDCEVVIDHPDVDIVICASAGNVMVL